MSMVIVEKSLSTTEIANLYKMSSDTLCKWQHRGQKFACLTAGGTLYFLVLLAALNLDGEVANKVQYTAIASVGRVLKCPDSSGVPTRDNKAWTENERLKVENSSWADDLTSLDAFMNSNDRTLKDDETYIRFSTKSLKGNSLKVTDSEGELLFLALTNMQEALGPQILSIGDKLHALFWNEDMDDNSRQPGFEYLAQHYSIYNCYCEKGNGAPQGVYPDYSRKKGAQQVNYKQRLPHPSKELLDNIKEYHILAEMLSDVGHYISENLKHHLPDVYAKLNAFTSILLLFFNSPVHPFGGFVVNIAACSNGHKDSMDRLICVIIAFGCWTGGDLCLKEAGVALKLDHANAVIFQSGKITHFNTHYEGYGVSFVLHSDTMGEGWVYDLNGWRQQLAVFNTTETETLVDTLTLTNS
ncbi:hypothetical protein DXG01_015441 [Tephrocybe rancida]|nr:hypothetical protein DXG01_015441 [Tephrocybe rancida]